MENKNIVLKFYKAFQTGTLNADLFTEDFHFTGIIEGFNDMRRSEFVDAFNKISPLVREHRLSDLVCENDKVFVSLDFISNPPEVKDTRFADLFTCREGKISQLITHFDPRAFFVLPEFNEN